MYYIYVLTDPRTGFPFYLGKGKGNRCNAHFFPTSKDKNPYKDNVIKKIISLGLKVGVVKILENIADEATAYKVEAVMIRLLGRRNIDRHGMLTNICIDQRPPSTKGLRYKWNKPSPLKGKKMVLTPETLQRLRIARKGKTPWNKGKRHSTETIEKIRSIQQGKSYHTLESKAAISRARTGVGRGRRYTIKSPDGVEYKTDCLSDFCRKHDISERNLKNTLRLGKPLLNGWMAMRD